MNNLCEQIVRTALVAAVMAASSMTWGWQCVPSAGSGSTLKTPWGERVTPENAWREYPRPQLVRANWTCLNGLWDYAVTSVTNTPGRPTRWDGKILVPFALESQLSGVGRHLESDEFLWYTRTIDCAPKKGERLLLHFDGVDFRAMVFIGHREVTDVPHAGAQEPFTLDITDYVKPGANELTVCTWDPTENFVGSRGKQCKEPKGCFYTRCSGIWQSVWMETVPETYVADYDVVPDIDAGTVTIEVKVKGQGRQRTEISLYDADSQKVGNLLRTPNANTYTYALPSPRLWSPEDPYLYSFVAKCGRDEVRGYFAMRKFSKAKDAKGVLRFHLNNRPCYVMGTLDQGWWPDGLLTPPSEEAMAHDIKTLKACGFNAMRKHIKVEPRRYYALCDRLGILVLQDLPSAADHDDFIACGPYHPRSVVGYGFQRHELKAMIDNLRKTPSVVMWIPYNEGWSQPGEFLTHATLDWVKRYDPTRLVNGPSGWCDFEGGSPVFNCHPKWEIPHKGAGACEAGDVIDQHCYRGPEMPPVNERRISFLGEFGGLGHPVSNHVWKATNTWGYGGIEDTKTRAGLEKTYLGLMDKLGEFAEKGLGGSIYTQTTDVEVEINGLMTYDRKVLKFDPEVLRRAHEKIIRSGACVADVAPLSVREARTGKAIGEDTVKCYLVIHPGEKGASKYALSLEKRRPGDVALEIEYAVAFPAAAGTLVWHHDMRSSRALSTTDGIVRNASRQAEVGSGYLSYWPFAAVTGADGTGKALALDPEYPAFYNIFLDAKTRRLVLHLDIALTDESPKANVSFVEYAVGGKSPFRSALKGYYDLYPKAFVSRVKEHGVWMPFSKISEVKGWEDFGFKFKEGNNEPEWDKAHGIHTFMYTEPTTWWQDVKGPTNAYDLAKAAELVKTNTHPYSKGWKDGVFHDREGKPVGFIKDTPWCKGVVWNLNDAPGVAGQTGWKLKMDHAPRCEYVDSAEMYVTVPLDFNRAHFGGMKTPLCWDAKTGRPAVFKGLIGYEYVRAAAEKAHSADFLTMANGTPMEWFWLAPNLDVLGTEWDWQDWRDGKRVWTPPSDTELIYRRALCGKKPFCFLMNTDFAIFTPERAQKYFDRCLAYGAFPGFFSIDAATAPYFTRPELYERDRALYKKYLPLVKTISELGWSPDNTLLEASDTRVISEQFGDRYVTLFNPLDKPLKLKIRFAGKDVRELLAQTSVTRPDAWTEIILAPESARLYRVNP